MGCPKNTVDSEGISQLLRQQGYEPVDHPARADILIVNTCGFIEAARQESLEALRELAQGKRRKQLLLAAGCFPQRPEFDLLELVPQLDGCISTRHWTDFPAFLEWVKANRGPDAACSLWEPARPTDALVAPVDRVALSGASAYIKIADGCDAACAFCAIPMIKGKQRSKPAQQIIAEAQQLASQGVREAVLVGQDTTAYGRDLGEQDALPGLLTQLLDQVPALSWVRVMYTFPGHITPDFVQAMAANDRICNYVDMPLQHSHPSVLRRMRRPHDVAQVRQLIDRLRQAIPDVALRTTFIVGYPGETDQEFEHLLDWMEDIAFDKVGIFQYSPEPGTPAAALPDQVPDEIKQARYDEAMTLQQGISLARNKAQIGRSLDVLIEGVGDGITVGRSYRDAPEIDGLVLLPGTWPVGQFVRARIVQAMEYDLAGEVRPRRA